MGLHLITARLSDAHRRIFPSKKKAYTLVGKSNIMNSLEENGDKLSVKRVVVRFMVPRRTIRGFQHNEETFLTTLNDHHLPRNACKVEKGKGPR